MSGRRQPAPGASPKLSRRVLLAAVASVSLAWSPRARAMPRPPGPVADWLRTANDAPFSIPDDLVGLHSDHGLGAAVPKPAFPFDAVRSHDTDDGEGWPATQWARIERRPGVYDWTAVDRWIAAHPGRTRIWVLFGCPAAYQKYPGEPWRYPYLPGGGSPPRDPATAARFVSALLARHPGAVRFVEIWNEPNFGSGRFGSGDRWLPTAGGPGFFTGTPADLAGLARAVKRVLPPGVGLMAGAWEGQARDGGAGNSLLRFSRASDGTGGLGRDHVDALSVHLYDYHRDPAAFVTELRDYRRRFAEAGYRPDLPLYVTEVGAEAPGAWTSTDPPSHVKERTIRRWLMIPAALGISGVYLYKHSSLATLGAPATDPAIGATIAAARDDLRGRTVASAARLTDGTIWLSFTDGTAISA